MHNIPDLREHLDRMLQSHLLEEVWALHTEAMAEYGFDRVIYGYTGFKSENSLGPPEDFLVLSNHNACYVHEFVHGGLYLSAPMLRWATENSGPCSWRWIEEHYDSLSPAEKKVVAFNKANGVHAGYSLSFPGTSVRAHGLMALAGRPGLSQRDVDEIWDEHGRDLSIINEVAHLKISSLPHTRANPLSPRQREVLEWVGEGKTIQEIGTILGLTPATVEKHLRNARDKLNVSTTAQAVLKASLKQQIFIMK